VAVYSINTRKVWIIQAGARGPGRTIGWVLGGGDAAPFQRRYDQGKHVTDGVFYTDNWDAFAQV
jgi:IS1 family transposase